MKKVTNYFTINIYIMNWIIYAFIALLLASIFQISVMLLASYDRVKKNLSSKLVSSLWLFVIIGIFASIGLFIMNLYGENTSINIMTKHRPLLFASAFALMLYEISLMLSMGHGGGGYSSLIAGLSYIFVILFGVLYFKNNINLNVIIGIIATILATIYTIYEREKLQ